MTANDRKMGAGETMFGRLSAAGIFMIPLCIYLYFFIRRILKMFASDNMVWLQRGVSGLLAVLITAPAYNLFGLWAALILHFAVISAVVDMIRSVIKVCLKRTKRVGRKQPGIPGQADGIYDTKDVKDIKNIKNIKDIKNVQEGAARSCRSGEFSYRAWDFMWRSGILAAVMTLSVLAYAYVNMHHVVVTEYTVSTEKDIRDEGYEIVFLSDLHFGTTMDQEQLSEYCDQIEEEEPDLVVLGGDIVDESASLQQVREAFGTLGRIDSTYGVYYVYGNHDKGRYAKNCDFTEQQLSQTIRESGIGILEDETAEINGELSLSGRQDRSDARRSDRKRKSAARLLKDIPDSSFHILADHQPRGMEENEKAGYDLMLSGHTHAGQMWPVGLITTLFDKETVNYGRESFGDMELIVSSGIAGWGYPLRTGKHCEFVVVHLKK